MPSTGEVDSVVRVSVSKREGAGEPLGETAPPPGILQAMGDDLRCKLPDELVDELLAGASSEEEIVGPGGLLGQLTKRLVEAIARSSDSPSRKASNKILARRLGGIDGRP